MKLRKIVAAFLVSVILCTTPVVMAEATATQGQNVSPAVALHELYDYMYGSASTLESKTVGMHDYQDYISQSVPASNLQSDGNGGYIRAEHIDGKVYIEYYDKDFGLLTDKTKSYDVELAKFGGVFYGSEYNYIFSGNGTGTSQGEFALQQFDKSWNYIKTSVHEDHSLVQNAINAGTASFSEYGDMLIIHSCMKMHPGIWDEGAHQGCIIYFVYQDELRWEFGTYFQASHSFNQYVINDGENLYTLDQSDGAPRAMYAVRYNLNDYDDSSYSAFNKCGGSSGDNRMGAAVGGFNFAGNRIITVVSSVDQEIAWTEGDEQKNIVVYSHSKDLSEYDEVWLTDYAPCQTDLAKGWIEMGNPYLVPTGTEYSYVMWEEWCRDDGLHYIRIAKIDSYGNLVGNIHSVYGRLGCNQPIYENGNLIWYSAGEYVYGAYLEAAPTFYKLSLQKLEAGKYDFSSYVDISGFDAVLECYDYYYKYSTFPTPKVISLKYNDKNYELKEGVDYTVTYDNIRVGTATATITGLGPSWGGIFKGTIVEEFTIHKTDISNGWELRLNPSTVYFDPTAMANPYPEYAVYNAEGELEKYITGQFSIAGAGSLWAAGSVPYSFTTDFYGHTGTIYANYVIEPYPAQNLEITLSGEQFTYTGNEIRPYETVYYVTKGGRTRVDAVEQHGTKTYTNYTVSYSNNVNPGTATVTIAFQGNYSGTVTKTFTIKSADTHTHTGGTATCKARAVCTICNKAYGNLASHKEGTEWVVTKPATVSSAGTKKLYCTVCNQVVKTSTIPKLTSFTDVKKTDFFYMPVQWAVSNSVTAGLTNTTFGPNQPCTRAQAVTFLWRAAGSPTPKKLSNPFVDVKSNAYYYKAVLWAVENGITAGVSSTSFAPNNTCTRAQIVTFLWRMQGNKKVSAANPFTDVKTSDYFYNAVLWAVKNNITAGITKTSFAPQSSCTRGQIVTFLYRNYN